MTKKATTPVRGKRGALRIGLALAYAGNVLNDLGHVAEQTDPSERHEYRRLITALERLREEIARLFGNPCEHCDGWGSITWGSSELQCNVCGGTGKASATTALTVQIADAIENRADFDKAMTLGREVAKERHM